MRPGVVAPGRRWAYTAAGLGAAVSVAANIGHSYVPPLIRPGVRATHWSPHPGAVLLAAFWPIALFVVVEVLTRTPWPAGARWVALRWLGLLPVALVTAIVSYRHLSGLLHFYGEDSVTVALGPLAVDGLMTMGAGALLATAAAIATEAATQQAESDPLEEIDPEADAEVPDGEQTAEGDGRGQLDDPLADELLPVVRKIAEQLAEQGQKVTRAALLSEIRGQGHPCSTERAGVLLRHLRQLQAVS